MNSCKWCKKWRQQSCTPESQKRDQLHFVVYSWEISIHEYAEEKPCLRIKRYTPCAKVQPTNVLWYIIPWSAKSFVRSQYYIINVIFHFYLTTGLLKQSTSPSPQQLLHLVFVSLHSSFTYLWDSSNQQRSSEQYDWLNQFCSDDPRASLWNTNELVQTLYHHKVTFYFFLFLLNFRVSSFTISGSSSSLSFLLLFPLPLAAALSRLFSIKRTKVSQCLWISHAERVRKYQSNWNSRQRWISCRIASQLPYPNCTIQYNRNRSCSGV